MSRISPLRRAIFEDGRSQKAIAEAAGIHPVTLSRIVGGASCDEATRDKVAHALGTSVHDLWPDLETRRAA